MDKPKPIDTSGIAEGWTCGVHRDDVQKTTPCLVPCGELTESEKAYDRSPLKLIPAPGCTIEMPGTGEDAA